MFQTSYERYSSRSDRVEAYRKAQQKSQRISDATTGKTKKRKPENKGKHRTRTLETSSTLRDTTSIGKGESITTNVNIIRRGNRRGQGRPPASAPARTTYGSSLTSAFGPRRKSSESEISDVVKEIRRVFGREGVVRQAPPQAPPPPPVQQRDLRQQQQREQREARERQQREAERQAREAREEARADERVRLEARRIDVEARRVEYEARGIAEINARIDRLDANVRAGQQIAPPQITVNPNIEVNPQITVNPTFNNYGNAEAERRGRRAVGGRRGGGGGRQNFRGSDSSSSGSDWRGGGRGRRSQSGIPSSASESSDTSFSDIDDRRRRDRSESANTKRERRARAAEQRSPQSAGDVEARTPEEEAQTLYQLAGGGLATAGEIGATAIGTAGSVISRGVGGLASGVARRLPSAEDVGGAVGGALATGVGIAGRTAIGVGSELGRRAYEQLPPAEDVLSGATTLIGEALRPTQEEQETSALLESISDVDISGEESVIPYESRAPEGSPRRKEAEQGQLTMGEKVKLRKQQQAREFEEYRRNQPPLPPVPAPKPTKRTEQTAILESLQRTTSRAGNLLAEAVSQGGKAIETAISGYKPVREVGKETTSFTSPRNIESEDPEFSSEGEQAGKVLIRTTEPEAEFRESYFKLSDLPRQSSLKSHPNIKPTKIGDVIEFSDGRKGQIAQYTPSRRGQEAPTHISISGEEIKGSPQILIRFEDGSEGGINYSQLNSAVKQGKVSRQGKDLTEQEKRVVFASSVEQKTQPQPEPERQSSSDSEGGERGRRSKSPSSGPPTPVTFSDESDKEPSSKASKKNIADIIGDLSTSSSSESESEKSGDEARAEFLKLEPQEKFDKVTENEMLSWEDFEERDVKEFLTEDGKYPKKGIIRIDGVYYRRDNKYVIDGKGKRIAEIIDNDGVKDLDFLGEQGTKSEKDEAYNHFRRVEALRDEDEYDEENFRLDFDLTEDGKSIFVSSSLANEPKDNDEFFFSRKVNKRISEATSNQQPKKEPKIDESLEVSDSGGESDKQSKESVESESDEGIDTGSSSDSSVYVDSDEEPIYSRRDFETRRGKGIESKRFKTKINDKVYVIEWDDESRRWLAYRGTRKGNKRESKPTGYVVSETSDEFMKYDKKTMGSYVLLRDTPTSEAEGVNIGGIVGIDTDNPAWKGFPKDGRALEKAMSEGGLKEGERITTKDLSKRQIQEAIDAGWIKFIPKSEKGIRQKYLLDYPHPLKGKIAIELFDENSSSELDSEDEKAKQKLKERGGRLRKLVESDSSGGETMDTQNAKLRELNDILKKYNVKPLRISNVTSKAQINFNMMFSKFEESAKLDELYEELLKLKSKVQKKQRRKNTD